LTSSELDAADCGGGEQVASSVGMYAAGGQVNCRNVDRTNSNLGGVPQTREQLDCWRNLNNAKQRN